MRSLPRHSARAPKILGADVELANFLTGVETPDGTGNTKPRIVTNVPNAFKVSS